MSQAKQPKQVKASKKDMIKPASLPKLAKKQLYRDNVPGAKAKRPVEGVPFDKNQLLQLIKEFRGNVGRIADALGATRHNIRKACERDEELFAALAEARERYVDDLEDTVWNRSLEGLDTTLQIFLLKTLGRNRGYEQDDRKMLQEVASAAFDFVMNKSKNPAEKQDHSHSDQE